MVSYLLTSPEVLTRARAAAGIGTVEALMMSWEERTAYQSSSTTLGSSVGSSDQNFRS